MEIDITGARIFYTFPFEIPILGKLQITETMVISWVVMLLITGLCIWLAHDLAQYFGVTIEELFDFTREER